MYLFYTGFSCRQHFSQIPMRSPQFGFVGLTKRQIPVVILVLLVLLKWYLNFAIPPTGLFMLDFYKYIREIISRTNQNCGQDKIIRAYPIFLLLLHRRTSLFQLICHQFHLAAVRHFYSLFKSYTIFSVWNCLSDFRRKTFFEDINDSLEKNREITFRHQFKCDFLRMEFFPLTKM